MAENPNSIQRCYNQPEPQLCETPYEDPPKPANPVVRGLSLHYGSSLISSVNAISSYLWSNAGFTLLRNLPELYNFQPRYDPTVTPVDGLFPNASSVACPVASPSLASRAPPDSASKRFPSIADYYSAYSSGLVTPSDVSDILLSMICRDTPKPTDHATAFLETKVDAVKLAAEASTARWKTGKALGLLDGVPISVKDETDIEGYRTTLGSKRVFKVKGTSWCVKMLLDAGAIVIGKSTMHELGTDTTNNNPVHGTPLNPYDQNYYCGGSSGGSAYTICAGLVPLAIGADGGGSIRIPASFCGIYGLKTSHGRISRLPTMNISSTCGVIGPMGANMLDIEVGFRAMSTPDTSHPSSSLFPNPLPAPLPLKVKLLGIYQPWFNRADSIVRTACNAAIDYFRNVLDYSIVDVTIPLLHAGQTAHALTCLTELAAGHPGSLSDLTAANKVLLSVGRHTPASDFLLAQRLRELLMRHLAALFRQHPGLVIVTPTTTLPGWRIGGGAMDLKYGVSDANMSTRNMEYVWLANLCGCPCLQVPVGYVETEGGGKVPIGMMGMTEWGKDEEIIGWGYDAERWLNDGLESGRQMPQVWVDVLEIAKRNVV